MNHWQKLGLPVALGICAAYFNWQSVSRKLTPHEFVAVKNSVKAGDKLSADSFKKVSISHSAGVDLGKTLVSWSKVDALVNRFAERGVEAGTLMTQFDIAQKNVSETPENQDELEVRMSSSERESSAYFVNDTVDVRHLRERALEGCRILSIIRDKEDYRVIIAADRIQLQNLEGRRDFDRRQLRIYGHSEPTKAVNITKLPKPSESKNASNR